MIKKEQQSQRSPISVLYFINSFVILLLFSHSSRARHFNRQSFKQLHSWAYFTHFWQFQTKFSWQWIAVKKWKLRIKGKGFIRYSYVDETGTCQVWRDNKAVEIPLTILFHYKQIIETQPISFDPFYYVSHFIWLQWLYYISWREQRATCLEAFDKEASKQAGRQIRNGGDGSWFMDHNASVIGTHKRNIKIQSDLALSCIIKSFINLPRDDVKLPHDDDN